MIKYNVYKSNRQFPMVKQNIVCQTKDKITMVKYDLARRINLRVKIQYDHLKKIVLSNKQ